jgi:threonine dehydrogenase-like Zn-dependent dehydrogenase
MRGLTFEGDRKVSVRDFPDPRPGFGEIVIRVTASGMCGSDLHYYRADSAAPSTVAQRQVIGGHEPAGVVEEVGPGVAAGAFQIGQRVMVVHYAGCGRCTSCRSGWLQMCSSQDRLTYGKNAHGGHAPYMSVAANSVLPLPDGVSDLAAAAIGCGTGTAWGALERLGDVGGHDLVVFGQGPVGLSATMLATARGARVIAVDLAGKRLAQATRLGAVATINPTETDPVEVIRDLTEGGPDMVLETSGATAAASAALVALAPWGRLCAVGLGGRVEVDVRQYLSRQLTVMTSWSLSSVQQLQCAQFIARRRLPVDDLFTHRWTLEQASEAYADFDRQVGGKAAFVSGSGGGAR